MQKILKTRNKNFFKYIYIGGREYSKKIKKSIIAGDMEAAANEILNGPQTAKVKGVRSIKGL